MKKETFKKTRKVDNPYAIATGTGSSGWTWHILKLYQTPANTIANPYGRVFCAVKSPNTFGSWEYGDTYLNDILDYAVITKSEISELPKNN